MFSDYIWIDWYVVDGHDHFKVGAFPNLNKVNRQHGEVVVSPPAEPMSRPRVDARFDG